MATERFSVRDRYVAAALNGLCTPVAHQTLWGWLTGRVPSTISLDAAYAAQRAERYADEIMARRAARRKAKDAEKPVEQVA